MDYKNDNWKITKAINPTLVHVFCERGAINNEREKESLTANGDFHSKIIYAQLRKFQNNCYERINKSMAANHSQ